MKRILLLAACAVLLLAAATRIPRTNELFVNDGKLSVTNVYTKDPQRWIDEMKREQVLSNVVNKLVAEGTFCQIRGHHWELGNGAGWVFNPAGEPMRHCTTCSAIQTQTIGDWK